MKTWLNKLLKTEYAKAAVLGLLPLISIGIYLLFQGERLSNVSLAASPWNDELFYYKQVESILKYGYPQGYFGFNESHALRLSYAAWSPVLVWPWLLFGKIFGWKLLTPVICNLLVYMGALFAFGRLMKPTWKQVSLMAVLYLLFVNNSRYILSGMPEVLVWSQLIVQYGLAYYYEVTAKEQVRKRRGAMAVMLANGVIMTWMRPYLILFLFLAIYYLLRDARAKKEESNKKAFAISSVFSCGLLGVTGLVYYLLNHFLAAQYLTPLFYTDWIKTYFTDGFLAGLKFTFGTLYYKGYAFCEYMWSGVTTGEAAGAIFVAFVLMMGLLCVLAVVDLWKQRGKKKDVGLSSRVHLAICFVAMFFAILLMYKLTEGSKHLLTFLIAGVFVIPTRFEAGQKVGKAKNETKKAGSLSTLLTLLAVAISFWFLFIVRGTEPYDYQVPFGSPELTARLDYWQQVFDEHLILQTEDTPNYDNVIIWTLSDCHVKVHENEDGSKVVSEYLDWVATDWQMLYTVPRGFGISCCYQNYVTDAYYSGTLKCNYLMSLSGGILDYILGMDEDWVEIGRDDGLVAYMRHNL